MKNITNIYWHTECWKWLACSRVCTLVYRSYLEDRGAACLWFWLLSEVRGWSSWMNRQAVLTLVPGEPSGTSSYRTEKVCHRGVFVYAVFIVLKLLEYSIYIYIFRAYDEFLIIPDLWRLSGEKWSSIWLTESCPFYIFWWGPISSFPGMFQKMMCCWRQSDVKNNTKTGAKVTFQWLLLIPRIIGIYLELCWVCVWCRLKIWSHFVWDYRFLIVEMCDLFKFLGTWNRAFDHNSGLIRAFTDMGYVIFLIERGFFFRLLVCSDTF